MINNTKKAMQVGDLVRIVDVDRHDAFYPGRRALIGTFGILESRVLHPFEVQQGYIACDIKPLNPSRYFRERFMTGERLILYAVKLELYHDLKKVESVTIECKLGGK